MGLVPNSWWVVAGLGVTAAAIAMYAVWESRRHFATQPGAPYDPTLRLGPPTDLCAANKHHKCDGRNQVDPKLTVQCGCTCHKSD